MLSKYRQTKKSVNLDKFLCEKLLLFYSFKILKRKGNDGKKIAKVGV